MKKLCRRDKRFVNFPIVFICTFVAIILVIVSEDVKHRVANDLFEICFYNFFSRFPYRRVNAYEKHKAFL